MFWIFNRKKNRSIDQPVKAPMTLSPLAVQSHPFYPTSFTNLGLASTMLDNTYSQTGCSVGDTFDFSKVAGE